MEFFAFDPSVGHPVRLFGGDFVLSPLIGATDTARTVCMHLQPGDAVGEHEATTGQLFCVVVGEGWVSGGDGEPRGIRPFQAAYWVPGERHAAGTDNGMVAVVLEGGFSVAARPVTDPG